MIELTNLKKNFGKQNLFSVDHLVLPNTGLVVLKGENGSGKTTLLNILSFLDPSFEGEYKYNGKDVRSLKGKEMAKIRRNDIAYVFQKNNLLTFLSASENLNVYDKSVKSESKRKANTLSQGQQEIIALKRSLKYRKRIYFFDEVLSSLDHKNREYFIDRVKELSKYSLVVVVSHDVLIDSIADEIYEFGNHTLKQVKTAPSKAKDSTDQNGICYRLSHKSFSLKYLFSTRIFTLLNTVLLSLIMMLGYCGCEALRSDMLFSSIPVVNTERCVILGPKSDMTSDEIRNKFPDHSYHCIDSRIPIGQSDSVPQDSLAYCNQTTYDYYQAKYPNCFKDNHIVYPDNQATYDFVIDNTVDSDIFLMNEKNNESDYFRSELNYADWVMKENYSLVFINEDTFKKEYNLDSLPIRLKDDTFYVFNPELVSNHIEKYDVPSFSSDNDYEPDFNKLFGSAMRAEYVNFGFEVKSGLYSDTVLISNNTARKLESEYDKHDTVILETKGRRLRLAYFLSSHLYTIVNPIFEMKSQIDDMNDKSAERHPVSKYNSYVSSVALPTSQFTYGMFYYLMFVLIVLCEIGFFAYTLYQNRENIRALSSLGMTKSGIFFLLMLPFFVTFFLSSIIGGMLSLVGVSFRFFSFFYGSLYTIFSLLLVMLAGYLMLSWRLKK